MRTRPYIRYFTFNTHKYALTQSCVHVFWVLQGDEKSLSFSCLLFWQLWAGSGNGKSLNLPLLIRKTRDSQIASHTFLSVPKRKGKWHMLRNKGLQRKAHGAQLSVSIGRAIECYCFDGAHRDANAVGCYFIIYFQTFLYLTQDYFGCEMSCPTWSCALGFKMIWEMLQNLQNLSNVIGEWRCSSLGVDNVFLYLE